MGCVSIKISTGVGFCSLRLSTVSSALRVRLRHRLRETYQVARTIGHFLLALESRFRTKKIHTLPALQRFVQTRAAYIAQTSLYGYLKTRMGKQYVDLFQDETFAPSIDRAKWHSYAGCLSDLALYVLAQAVVSWQLDRQQALELGEYFLDQMVVDALCECELPELSDQTAQHFRARVLEADWPHLAEGEQAFSQSAQILLDAAPVSDEFKQLDGEIVRNSVRFRWDNIRRQFARHSDMQKLSDQWRERRAGMSAD